MGTPFHFSPFYAPNEREKLYMTTLAEWQVKEQGIEHKLPDKLIKGKSKKLEEVSGEGGFADVIVEVSLRDYASPIVSINHPVVSINDSGHCYIELSARFETRRRIYDRLHCEPLSL